MSYTWCDLRAWVLKHNPEVDDIGPDVDIIETRTVNSLQFVELMLHVEELTGRELQAEEINIDSFRTLRAIETKFLAM